MKKVVCMILALLLCMTGAALAEATPSRGVDDLYTVSLDAAGDGWIIYLVDPAEDATAAAELEKLKAAEPVETYFGEVKDSTGKAVSPKELLALDTVNVHEFYRLKSSGPEGAPEGPIQVKFVFPTQYADGEKVVVMIGTVAGENVAWTAYEAEAANVAGGAVEGEGGIMLTFTPDMIKAVIEQLQLIAVVSK